MSRAGVQIEMPKTLGQLRLLLEDIGGDIPDDAELSVMRGSAGSETYFPVDGNLRLRLVWNQETGK